MLGLKLESQVRAEGPGNPQIQKCPRCGIEYQAGICPACGGSPPPSAAQTRKTLNNYSLLLAPGIFAGLIAFVVFPPLDDVPLVALGLCLLFLPMVMQLSSVIRKRLSEDLDRLRKAYVYASLALLLLGLVPLLNGWLDKSPASAVKATVIRKTASRGRGGTSYYLIVSSWRPGRSDEELRVGVRTFNNASVGRTITVEVHKGYFGLPWDGGISSK